MKLTLCIIIPLLVALVAAAPRRRFPELQDRIVLFPRAPSAHRRTSTFVKDPNQPRVDMRETCDKGIKYPPQENLGGSGESGRIVGGEEVVPYSVPWQVNLLIDATYFCGGSIIGERWILTAAHCLDEAFYVEITAADHNWEITEPLEITFRSEQLTVHPRWDTNTITNDVGLIRLIPVYDFTNPRVQPICLHPSTPPVPSFVGETLTVTGWGKTSDSSGISPVLNRVSVTGIGQPACQQIYGDIITGSILCTSTENGGGTCGGDSGGPLTFTAENGIIKQVGIVSFGASDGCVAYPNGFTRVTSFVDWISEQTGIIW